MVRPTRLPEAQEGLWYAQQLDPSNPVFWTAQRVDITGHLEIAVFATAIAEVLLEAEALCLPVLPGPDGPVLSCNPFPPPSLELFDLRGHLDPARALTEWIATDLNQPRDPAADPLIREAVLQTAADEYCWYQGIHHLVIDGFGTALLTRRIVSRYRELLNHSQTEAPLTPYSCALQDDTDWRHSAQRSAAGIWWHTQLIDAPEVTGLAPGIPLSGHAVYRHEVSCPSVGNGLKGLADRSNTTWPDSAVGLIASWLARQTGEDEVILGIPTMNRFGQATARVATMVMNVLPVRIPVNDTQPLTEAIGSVARSLRAARRHGRYRGEQLRRDLGRLGGQRRLHGPLVNILPFDEPLQFPGATARTTALATGPVDDLSISLRADSQGDGLRVLVEANPALYSREKLVQLSQLLIDWLGRAPLVDNLSRIGLLNPHDQEQWLNQVNRTEHPLPADLTLTSLVERELGRDPERIAMLSDQQSWTAVALEQWTRRLACSLTAQGVGPGMVVAVTMPRSPELVAALIAIIRAGGAWLPLDPEHPEARRLGVLQLGQPVLHLVDHLDRHPPGATIPALTLEQLSAIVGPESQKPTPTDLAYLLFTSGSTGEPKGVMIEHRSIVNRLLWMRDVFGIGPAERILLKTPATFDVSVWEFFLPFISGATLVVAPDGAHRDPVALASVIRRHAVTVVHFVPSMLEVFLTQHDLAGLPLKTIFSSGEALSAALRQRTHQLLEVNLENLYGPTEAAVDVTWWSAGPEDRSDPVPIGFPVWNTSVLVTDRFRHIVPPGIAGDLLLGGVQLARGYRGRPELTAERFIADPGVPGAILYHTGDRARWRTDGAIEYLGRGDGQIKLRGIRIELSEIESALRRLPGIDNAVVLLREDRPGDPRLAAYLVATGPHPDPAELTQLLANELPEPMVPTSFQFLHALPVTANGKLFRAALPAPELPAAGSVEQPRTPTEVNVAEAFASVLHLPVDQIGRDADFFLLGGHSLLAAKLSVFLRETMQRQIELGTIFAQPTVARLAAAIEAESGAMRGIDDGMERLILLAGDPASPLHPLCCIHPAGGLSWCYGALARACGGRPVWGVQAAGLREDEPLPDSLDTLSDDYISHILAEQSEGPINLIGWSIGGIIAQTMAARLEQRGARVGLVALLDAYPSDRWRLEADPTEADLLRALLLMAGVDPDRHPNPPGTRDQVIALFRERDHPLGYLSDAALHGVMRVVAHNNRLVRAHQQPRYSGTVIHIKASHEHAGTSVSAEEWAPYVGSLISHALPTTHVGLMSAAMAPEIATLLQDWMP